MKSAIFSDLILHTFLLIFVGTRFVSPESLTVTTIDAINGTRVTLPCTFPNLGANKVLWFDPSGKLLSIGSTVYANSGIRIQNPSATQWNLIISKVNIEDAGVYLCTANTLPIQENNITLNVKVSPRIAKSSAENAIVDKGRTVTLFCNVTGLPRPTVTWYRLTDSQGTTKTRIGSGEKLVINKVKKADGGLYQCLADNNYPPTDSRQFHIIVQYAPEVHLPVKRMGQYIGEDTLLQCDVTAVPRAITSWEFNNRMIKTGNKYSIQHYGGDNEDSSTYMLIIRNLTEADVGDYTCTAANAIGETMETMKVYEYGQTGHATSRPITTERVPNRHKVENRMTPDYRYIIDFDGIADNSTAQGYYGNQSIIAMRNYGSKPMVDRIIYLYTFCNLITSICIIV